VIDGKGIVLEYGAGSGVPSNAIILQGVAIQTNTLFDLTDETINGIDYYKFAYKTDRTFSTTNDIVFNAYYYLSLDGSGVTEEFNINATFTLVNMPRVLNSFSITKPGLVQAPHIEDITRCNLIQTPIDTTSLPALSTMTPENQCLFRFDTLSFDNDYGDASVSNSGLGSPFKYETYSSIYCVKYGCELSCPSGTIVTSSSYILLEKKDVILLI